MTIAKLVALILIIMVLGTAHGFILLSQEEALTQMFSDVDDIEKVRISASPEQIEAMKEFMGGRLFLYQKGGKANEISSESEYTFFFGLKNGERVGAALIEKQPGKWGPIEYIVCIGMDGKIQNLAVMSFVEKRGKPIAKRMFLKQFIGKGINDKYRVKREIRPISGATISSRSACFAVKKCALVFNKLYLNK